MTQPAADLTALEHDFATWRAQRSRGSRIPAELWGRAASAAKTHGVSRISQRLNLDYYALKRRAEPSELAGSQPAEPFVEISVWLRQ